MPQLPPSHVSRYEIGAYADLYKEGASIPQLPGISNPQTPAQTLTPQRPAPSFGSVVVKTVAHHLFKNSRFTTNLVQTDPAMAAPTFSNPEGPSGFDPDLQAKFPEAYALAVRIDQFGKNQIALLKVTMEPPKPSLFKEFAWLGRLLKKGTGHDLYTPGVHTEGFQPVAIKVEAMVLEAAQSTKRFALQRVNNPIQADIDVTLAFLRGAGELAKGTFEFLLDTNNPGDVISRDLLNTLDVLASNIDLRFTSMIHQINPAYNPHSPASQAGSELFKALVFERILIGKTAAITQGSARAVGGLAARSEGAFANQSALLGRINKPAYQSGFVSERAASKLAQREVRVIKPMELPYLQKGKDLKWFAENSPKIDQLRNMHTNPKKFYLALRKEFAPKGLNELQLRRTLDYAGFNTYVIPQGLPSNVVVEFSKKNGGMSYRLIGSTSEENLVVRVCPGLAKENVVSSVIKGNHLNGQLPGTLRQQYPYVVQTRGNLYRTIDGRWVRVDGKQYAKNKALTHIPLETYEFKGW